MISIHTYPRIWVLDTTASSKWYSLYLWMPSMIISNHLIVYSPLMLLEFKSWYDVKQYQYSQRDGIKSCAGKKIKKDRPLCTADAEEQPRQTDRLTTLHCAPCACSLWMPEAALWWCTIQLGGPQGHEVALHCCGGAQCRSAKPRHTRTWTEPFL